VVVSLGLGGPHSHFYTFHLDTPRLGRLVESALEKKSQFDLNKQLNNITNNGSNPVKKSSQFDLNKQLKNITNNGSNPVKKSSQFDLNKQLKNITNNCSNPELPEPETSCPTQP
jgi:hypothetical protein